MKKYIYIWLDTVGMLPTVSLLCIMEKGKLVFSRNANLFSFIQVLPLYLKRGGQSMEDYTNFPHDMIDM